jgi:hypothetical protein
MIRLTDDSRQVGDRFSLREPDAAPTANGQWFPIPRQGRACHQQTSTDTTDYRFPLAIHASLSGT